MALSFLDEKTRDLMSASYAIPDLETAVKQVIYNSIDAQAKTITLFVDVTNASFTAVDDGQGIQPDDLHEYIGECYATSRAPVSKCSRREEKPHKKYGSRGAFLQELTTLAAHVEIESRVKEHWTSYRKVFKEGAVVFNARSKELRKTAGTKVSVSNLFGKLPVRRKDLTRNRKYRSRVVQNTHNFCVSMSMIWPSLSFDIRYEGEDVRPVKIPAATSCRERFLGHFGQLLGKDLQYVDFSSKAFLFSIRGYFAFVPCALGGLGQGIKQAKSYYQFAFLENEWVEECHRTCSRVLTDAALEILSAIPIFVLKVAAPSRHYDISRVGKKNDVLFKNPEQLHQFLFEFVESLAAEYFNQAPKSDFQKLDDTEEIHEVPELNEAEDDEHLESHTRWLSAFEEHNVLVKQNYFERSRCHACGHVSDASIVHTDDDSNMDVCLDSDTASYAVTASDDSKCDEFAVYGLDREHTAVAGTEPCLEDIFFASRSHPPLMKQKVLAGIEERCEDSEAVAPWLSSKPDSYDCVNAMLALCQDEHHYEDSHHDNISGEQETSVQIDESPRCPESEVQPSHDTPVIAAPSTNSSYFAMATVERHANSFLKHWIDSKRTPVEHFADALRIDNVHVLKGNRPIKISKSTLAKLQVIRQVDRKFVLVQADTPQGKLVLCIDQHAADERVRLEQLEEEMFGHDGSLRRVDIQEHEPPIVLRVNFKEREVLSQYDDLIRSWGFDFELTVSEPESVFCVRTEHEPDDRNRVLLYATPKVEKRAANADDFREFIQVLANAGETYQHSQIRPPVITRLLHSRACRSAIMFGDHLSLGQCRDLIEDLKNCQLPFQCAHGRPSVVPLAEIHNE